MAIIQPTDLLKIREQYRDKVIVFCSGVFDLPHAGHTLFFEDCKKLGDVLVVAVAGDTVTREVKGEMRPILNEHVRLKTVDSFKPVDFVFLGPKPGYGHPFVDMEEWFRDLKPEKYAVNDDAYDMPMREKMAAKHGVELVVLPRSCPREFEGISTSKIIEKILKLHQEQNK